MGSACKGAVSGDPKAGERLQGELNCRASSASFGRPNLPVRLRGKVSRYEQRYRALIVNQKCTQVLSTLPQPGRGSRINPVFSRQSQSVLTATSPAA